MKRHIPNIITLCNLVCGSIAVNQAFCGHYTTALYFIVFGAIFDFFDGFAARKLHVSSPLGVELDSLADLITFGFAPSAMFFALLGNLANSYGFLTAINNNTLYFAETDNLSHINVAAFLIVAFSALRLAKFNLDSRQKTSFLGLPTPANALLLSSVAITVDRYYYSIICPEEPAAYLTAIIALMVLIALLRTARERSSPLRTEIQELQLERQLHTLYISGYVGHTHHCLRTDGSGEHCRGNWVGYHLVRRPIACQQKQGQMTSP